jgi:hypothetical protein
MSVLAIESTIIDDDCVTVEAIVDDMRCIYAATYSSPAEYAPALCRASFFLGDDTIPTDEDGFCRYLDACQLEWEPIDLGNDE